VVSVKVNGEQKKVADNSTIIALLKELEIESKVVACALNTSVVKDDKWSSTILKDGDEIEFLHFVGGGSC
jgi:sulfur carrier protein